MGVYTRPDSPFYWFAFDGFLDEKGNLRRESSRIRHDAPTAELRRDAKLRAQIRYHARITELDADASGGPGKRPRIRTADFLDWFETHVLPRRRGREREAEILPRWRAAFGARWLHEIDRALVMEWTTTRKASNATINREVDVLKGVLQAAVPKYLPASPLYGMPRLRSLTPKRRIMTEEEERRLLEVMAADDKALFLIGLDSLVRLGDLLDAKVADDHGGYLWVADPKAGGGFNVPVSTRARAALDVAKVSIDTFGYLFPRRRVAKTERDRRNGIRQMLERYCALATPPVPYGRKQGGITFHWATRRTGATRMLTRGTDPGTVQKVGRWNRPDVVLSIYHELLDDKARAAVESVGRESDVNGDRQNTPKPAKSRQTLRTEKPARKRAKSA